MAWRQGMATRRRFQLLKRYGASFAPWSREIEKPVAGSVVVAVDGVEQSGGAFSVDVATGVVTFGGGHIPGEGAR